MTQLWSSAQNNSLVLFALLFVLIIIFREIFLAQSSKKPFIYYVFLFPGIIVHELAHVTVCLVTFTKISSIKLFSKDGGFVLHQKPRFILVSFLISIAPLVAGLLIIYFVLKDLVLQSSASVAQIFTLKFVVILYFLSSILLTMLPSKQDILNALSTFVAIIFGLIIYFSLAKDYRIFSNINTLLLSSLIILVLLNIVIFIVNKAWKTT